MAMPDLESYTYDRERRTYIRGRFRGKFWADEDASSKSSNPFEGHFRVHIYEAEVVIEDARREQDGVYDGYENETPFLANFPSPVLCRRLADDGATDSYSLDILDIRLTEVYPIIQNAMAEGHERFGELEGKIYGFVLDTVQETVYVEKQESATEIVEFHLDRVLSPVVYPEAGLRTGEWQENGKYRRPRIHNGRGGHSWGAWEERPIGKGNKGCLGVFDDFFGCLGNMILVLFGTIFGFGLILTLYHLFGFSPLLLILVGIGLYLLWHFISWILQRLFVLISILFSIFVGFLLVSGIFSAWKNDQSSIRPENERSNREKRKIEPIPMPVDDEAGDSISSVDTLIMHERVWKATDGTIYQGSLNVRLSQVNKSHVFHRNYSGNAYNLNSFRAIYRDLSNNDNPGLDLIEAMFDSIRKANRLSGYKLADMIVSCVQDIDYVLVLDGVCDARQYSDAFVRDYLAKGKPCVGPIRFGVNAPLEFMEELEGDCDTRSLFLFNVLHRFGFKVCILGSELYGHSVLGIEVPGNGAYKTINNKRYYVWETTARAPLGQIDPQWRDMRYWDVMLTN